MQSWAGINGVNLVLKVNIDTAAEFNALFNVGQTTGWAGGGKVVLNTGPELNGTKPTPYTVGTLPAAGTDPGIVYFVTDANPDCATGGNSTPTYVFCLDDGTNYITVNAAQITIDQESCLSFRNITAGHDGLVVIAPRPGGSSRTLVGAYCHCIGTCPTPPAFAFRTGAGAAISLTGGGTLPCATGGSPATPTTFSTSDSDRILAPGVAGLADTVNTPAITEGDSGVVCVY
jgi:hypothetical protein